MHHPLVSTAQSQGSLIATDSAAVPGAQKASSDTTVPRVHAYYALLIFLVERCDKIPFQELTPTEHVLYLASTLHGQVENGGFDQWSYNGYDSKARETVAALRDIGAGEAARLLVRALRVMRKGEALMNDYEAMNRFKAAERVQVKLRAKLDALNAAYNALHIGTDECILAYAKESHALKPDSLPGYLPE